MGLSELFDAGLKQHTTKDNNNQQHQQQQPQQPQPTPPITTVPSLSPLCLPLSVSLSPLSVLPTPPPRPPLPPLSSAIIIAIHLCLVLLLLLCLPSLPPLSSAGGSGDAAVQRQGTAQGHSARAQRKGTAAQRQGTVVWELAWEPCGSCLGILHVGCPVLSCLPCSIRLCTACANLCARIQFCSKTKTRVLGFLVYGLLLKKVVVAKNKKWLLPVAAKNILSGATQGAAMAMTALATLATLQQGHPRPVGCSTTS